MKVVTKGLKFRSENAIKRVLQYHKCPIQIKTKCSTSEFVCIVWVGKSCSRLPHPAEVFTMAMLDGRTICDISPPHTQRQRRDEWPRCQVFLFIYLAAVAGRVEEVTAVAVATKQA